MKFTMLTMTRGDAHKIAEWVEYHSLLGFDDFQVILDGDIDGTETVLKNIDISGSVTIHPKEEVGDYYDGLSPEERWERVKAWREANRRDLESGVMRGVDPQSWRQHMHFSQVMDRYRRGDEGRGWLALFDVDEFLVTPGFDSLEDLVADFNTPRLRFLSFDVDTTGYDRSRPVLEQHFYRWSREAMLAVRGHWKNRVKSMVRYKKADLSSTLHKISSGASCTPDYQLARIHHFRMPNQPSVSIPYTVQDKISPRKPLRR